ncbi:FtsX-like permease family protein [Acutalibacter caecimuris]|uniref:FtsX-like permease family protein n=1 Tax=Acutalibacter caecimuris TaxID=3093657 RepID=UPI002AC95EF4|nr:FtsX-like permease family protein [Acutalibacter sp. M00118]
MFRISIKHLARTPGKALLFLLLLAGATMLLVFGAVLLVQTDQQLDAVEEQFTTIATVEQQPVEIRQESAYNECLQNHQSDYYVYDGLVDVSALDFAGAGYIQPPENRPYYVTKIGTVSAHTQFEARVIHVAEFTPLEDGDGTGPVECRVTQVLYSDAYCLLANVYTPTLLVGRKIDVCQHFSRKPVPLKAGARYMATLIYRGDQFVAYQMPFTSQYGEGARPYAADGAVPVSLNMWEEDGRLVCRSPYQPYVPSLSESPVIGLEEVTEAFYRQGGLGRWSAWASAVKRKEEALFYTLPTNSLALLPAFHNRKMYVSEGRAISQEEFDSGARVVMLPEDFAGRRGIFLGDTISLSFHCALYGYTTNLQTVADSGNYTTTSFQNRFSILDAQGEIYEPFWEETYEVVGLYASTNPELPYAGVSELSWDTMIIPQRSVGASDRENIAYRAPMNANTASFQIPNGKIEEFDRALRQAVPEMASLVVAYNDNGYTEVTGSLGRIWSRALTLFLVGVCGSVAVVLLLLYFFVVKEKKRTAIERGMGMSKGQCRTSILAGVMVLAVLGTALGSAGSALALHGQALLARPAAATVEGGELGVYGEKETQREAPVVYKGFDVRYSPWAEGLSQEEDIRLDEADGLVRLGIYFAAPGALLMLIGCLAAMLVNRSLGEEPLGMLSGKEE